MARKPKTEDELLVDFIGESISTESAILASAINLMRAGDIAKENRDSELLVKVAQAWYSLAKYMGSEDEDDKKDNHFGFVALESEIDEPGDDPHESEGGAEVRQKSGKLRKYSCRPRR